MLVVIGGVTAALHVGKLPPAIPVLRDALGVSLVQAGFLLSLVQFAGMTLGLAIGLAADGFGLKRAMVAGLATLSVASFLGGWARSPEMLMLLRALEGLGFLLAAMPAPSLIRRHVDPQRMNVTLGLWGAYMPFGTAMALLCGPFVMAHVGWEGWWWLLAALSALMSAWLWLALPADVKHASSSASARWFDRLSRTLSAPGPWLVSLSFAVYSAQWLAVIGFLPAMYAQAGLAGGVAAVATAIAAAVNMTGNIASGRLLQRGVRAQLLLYVGFAVMGVASVLAFSPLADFAGTSFAAVIRYIGVLAFSAVGGLIPGTLFSLAVRLAPGDDTVSTTVGWMQQWSAFGQFAGPPIVAWVATRSGNWSLSWTVTGMCALAGSALALFIGRLLRRAE